MGCIAINGDNILERVNDMGFDEVDEDEELQADFLRKNEDNETRFED